MPRNSCSALHGVNPNLKKTNKKKNKKKTATKTKKDETRKFSKISLLIYFALLKYLAQYKIIKLKLV